MHADYTYGEQKFGGNAQAITKQRWLHHTSFLWDFDDSNMALLQHPSRVPKYRLVRLCLLIFRSLNMQNNTLHSQEVWARRR